MTGHTCSNDFSTTAGAYDTSHNGGGVDAFVSVLSSDLSSLSYSTFLGGSNADGGNAIALDGAGKVYVTGYTYGKPPLYYVSDFPTIDGVYDTRHNGDDDVFVSVLNSDLSSLSYSTFLGGSSQDGVSAIALDGEGHVYVTGYTYSSGFPTTAGVYGETYNGDVDAFVAKFEGAAGAAIGGITEPFSPLALSQPRHHELVDGLLLLVALVVAGTVAALVLKQRAV